MSGGKIAAAVSPALDNEPAINLAFLTVFKKLNLPPPSPDTPPFHLSNPLVLENALIKAGFQDVKTENMIMMRLDSPDSFFTNYHKLSGSCFLRTALNTSYLKRYQLLKGNLKLLKSHPLHFNAQRLYCVWRGAQ
jgi:hypothetical protein